jgi:hypothetical protein
MFLLEPEIRNLKYLYCKRNVQLIVVNSHVLQRVNTWCIIDLWAVWSLCRSVIIVGMEMMLLTLLCLWNDDGSMS